MKQKKTFLLGLTFTELSLSTSALVLLVWVFNMTTDSSPVEVSQNSFSSSNLDTTVLKKKPRAPQSKKQKSLLLAQAPTPSPTQQMQLETKMQLLKKQTNCLKEQNCNYSQEDPRAYEIEAYRHIKTTIVKQGSNWVKHWSTMQPTHKKQILDLFQLESGHTKEALLKSFASSLPIEQQAELVPLVLDTFITNFHDGTLVPDTLKFLSQHLPTHEAKITQSISSIFKTGSPHMAEALSNSISLVLTTKNTNTYRKALKSLDEDSPEQAGLSVALDNFKDLEGGG